MSCIRHSLFIILASLASLAVIEGLAWWWMNPAATGPGEPVLAYRPVGLDRRAGPLVASGARSERRDQVSGDKVQESEVGSQEPRLGTPADDSASSSAPSSNNPKSTIVNPQSSISASPTDNGQPTTDNSSSSSPTDHRSPLTAHSPISPSQHFSVSAFQLLPDIYRQAAPMLRCTSGQVFYVKIHNTAGLHGAFFEWDGTDTGSVLEAFRHMPEACMGSIGMQLVSKEKPIPYTVGLDRRAGPLVANGAEREGNEKDRGQEEAPAQSTSSTAHRSLITDHSLLFDHTVFRDPGQGGNPLVPGPLVHSFRAVWVAGMKEADVRRGIDGQEMDRLRAIRLKAALTRYRPTRARVIQGAVRGFHTPEAAWAAFEEHMLRNLSFEPWGPITGQP